MGVPRDGDGGERVDGDSIHAAGIYDMTCIRDNKQRVHVHV